MHTDSAKFKLTRIGIECESIEEEQYGIGRFLYKVLEQLAARPHLAQTYRFHLYFKKRIPDYPFLASPMFVKIVTTPRWAPASFNLHYHIWMIIRAYWDRVAMLYFPNYMLPLCWLKKSMVVLTEDIHAAMRSPQLPFKYRLAYWIFTNWAAIAATRVVAISHTSAKELQRVFGIASKRITINPLAVDPARDVHGVTRTQPYLLWVGQAFDRRHLRETLLAFEQIAPTFANLQFVVVGPDKYSPPVIDGLVAGINQRLGRQAVIRFERVSDAELAALYANASAVTYISDLEAFGLPPVEALAYGTPAIVADVPISREIFGSAAFFVDLPITVESIVPALRDALLNMPHREYIKTTAPSIVEKYTWSGSADRFLTAIDEILHA